ncbi:chromate transporter [Paenibacillus sp. FSL H8-0548]|uniref:chromate transporter n=1 Tax=Paenibacillus sp. FSL H8-0548 TaxID=1920422 RepID=UPI00096E4B73|nr:chromate transporter [Paenibacillus sp. FSL H8-0548]OMF26492.1 chromate transporter [Paenibacillus sp. FSL H8-0548]
MKMRPPNGTSLLFQLFWTFVKIGPVTFGGGYTMIPMIEKEIVDKRKWITRQEMNDLMSLAGAAPGGIGVNASAFLGYRMGNIPGAIAATLGITLPSFIIVFLLSAFYAAFQSEPKVEAAFKGIHGAIIGLIATAAFKMGKTALFDWTTILISVCSLALLLLTKISPTAMILFGLGFGIVLIRLKQLLGLTIQTERVSHDNSAMIEYYI